MDPENDAEFSEPRTKQQTPSESLTLPPIELEKPVLRKKSSKKRRRLRRRRSKKFSLTEDDPSNLFSQKTQSSRSSNDRLRVSSLDSPGSYFSNPDRVSALKPMFTSFLLMQASGYTLLVPLMWYFQHCSTEEGSLTSFDNMVAYSVHIVSIGCVVFFTEVQTTSPYNIIYPCMVSSSLSYLVVKIVCHRELIVIMEMCVLVGIEGPTIFTIAVYSSKDFTPLTPILIAAYICTTVLNVTVIYFVGESTPIVMLSIISLFIAYGLGLCIMQFPITKDPRYSLPPNKPILGALMLNYAFCSLSQHTYMAIVAIFDVHGTKQFQYYVVNLTFYLEQ